MIDARSHSGGTARRFPFHGKPGVHARDSAATTEPSGATTGAAAPMCRRSTLPVADRVSALSDVRGHALELGRIHLGELGEAFQLLRQNPVAYGQPPFCRAHEKGSIRGAGGGVAQAVLTIR
jgi:hypothetical protein